MNHVIMIHTDNKNNSHKWERSDVIAAFALIVSILTFVFSSSGQRALCSIGVQNETCPEIPPCVIGTGDTCNCADFKSQRQAQLLLKTYPGDIHNLDGDQDGIACEKLLQIQN
ncbi:excalibur calcium-binding domain-containing protein [Moorena sp. SIO1G6]|uniref:excalibur calcium-binding domain-containing protein n=1 Tax=Moorena sp. SIO1G6 TaxID=2607840 RepID=UPI00257C0BFF|nr:excalibur calcium-binding domain-containing protein [Moorena sp. SIO1G6]